MDNKNLEEIFWKDKNGKLILNLTSLEKTAVKVPAQNDYWTLMRIYECGGWKGKYGELSAKNNLWTTYKEETCIGSENDCQFARAEYYAKIRWNVISLEEFYKIQKITPEMIKEINNYFEKNK